MKSVKKTMSVAIGESTLTFSELQTVCYKAANLVNERPIGRHPTMPEDGSYLCPTISCWGGPHPGCQVALSDRQVTPSIAMNLFNAS